MKVEDFLDTLRAAPFQPFTIHLAGGQTIEVPHPDFVALIGSGRSVVVTSPSDDERPGHRVVDVLLITHLEVKRPRAETR